MLPFFISILLLFQIQKTTTTNTCPPATSFFFSIIVTPLNSHCIDKEVEEKESFNQSVKEIQKTEMFEFGSQHAAFFDSGFSSELTNSTNNSITSGSPPNAFSSNYIERPGLLFSPCEP
uniref:Uncharacterized protein n=1 Tax=Caenorhabditis japonica TaxID=281687 RepID=A0A8R1DW85_CAEJA